MVGRYDLREWWESQSKLNFGSLINIFGRLILCYVIKICAYGRFYMRELVNFHTLSRSTQLIQQRKTFPSASAVSIFSHVKSQISNVI